MLLSGGEGRNLQRSLSAPSASPTSSPLKKTTMPLTSDKIDAALLDAIQAAVEKAVKTAVEAALNTFNEVIVKLQDDVSSLQKKIKDLDDSLADRTDELEQYQRRNNIRLFGIKETEREETDAIVTRICHDKLGIDIPVEAISRSHHVGKRGLTDEEGRPRHRPIIVQLTSYRTRRMVFDSKKKLKGTGVVIKEDLTHCRQDLYRRVVSRYGSKNVWTMDGRILWIDNGAKKVATRLVDLPTDLQNDTTIVTDKN